tara:strand:- start:91 stop:2274 length:2184 start_codon:yes stop_codon:yes gene_type:complete
MKTITFLLFFSFSISTLLAQDFYLNSNGVTCMCPAASVGDTGVVNGVTYTKRIRQQITPGNASTTCTSGITDMSSLFNQVIFNEDISSWDVSNVTNMNQMFAESYAFNQPIGYWDVSSVTNMNGLFFFTTAFNQPINDWNVSSVTDMGGMFIESGFNQPLDAWDVSNVTSMFTMFSSALAFNQSLDTWDVSNVGNMLAMFTNTPFNQDISSWNVGNVVNMQDMFTGSSFNQPLDNWDVSNVINMSAMFFNTPFNQTIGAWDVSSVLDMESMFSESNFNQPIGDWNVSNVLNMYNMFIFTDFDQDISNWQLNTSVDLQGMMNHTVMSVENYDLLLASMYNQPLVNKEFGDFSLSYCNISDHDALINEKGWTFEGGLPVSTSIIAPEYFISEVDSGACIATNIELGTPIAVGCGTLTISNNAPVEFPLGITEVIWTLTDGNGTSVSDTQIIEVFMVTDEASLCYVSADENQPENNQIFITSNTDLNGQNVDFHEVLRESSSGNYETIGFIVPPEESFIDITSDNNTQAYRYKVQTTDVCGQVLMLSDYHKTILLQSNIATDNSVNLSWSPYIGFSFDSYAIYRNVNGANFELLTTLASTNTSYNDSAADVVNNSYEYYIAIEAPDCNTAPLMSEFIKSNIEYINPNLGISELSYLENSISLFPNPTSSQVQINTSNDIDIIRVELYNVLGQQVNIATKSTIEMSYLPSGLYYLQISTDLGTVTKTIIRK